MENDLSTRVSNLENRMETEFSEIKNQIGNLTNLISQFMAQTEKTPPKEPKEKVKPANARDEKSDEENLNEEVEDTFFLSPSAELKREAKERTGISMTPHPRFHLTDEVPDFGKGMTKKEKRRSSNLFKDLPQVEKDVKDEREVRGAIYLEPAPTADMKLTKLTVSDVIEWCTKVHEYFQIYPDSKRTIATMVDRKIVDVLITHWNNPNYTALQFQRATYQDVMALIQKKLQARDPNRFQRILQNVIFPNKNMYENVELNSFTFKRYYTDVSAHRLTFLHHLNFHTTDNPNLEGLKIKYDLKGKTTTPLKIWTDSLPHQTYVQNVLNDMSAYTASYHSMEDFLSGYMNEMYMDNERAEFAKLLIEKNIPLNVPTRSLKVAKQREASRLNAFYMDESDMPWPRYALPDSDAIHDYFAEYEEMHALDNAGKSTRGCHSMLLKRECKRVKCTYSHEEADLLRLYVEYMTVLLHHPFRRLLPPEVESKPSRDQGYTRKLAHVEQYEDEGSDTEPT